MILTIKKCFVSILVLSLLVACGRSEIEDAPWNTNPVPVVYSIISPQQPVRVYLNKTYTSNFPPLKAPYSEATVFICGVDSNWVELTRLKSDTCVFLDTEYKLRIEQGKTYSLKIELVNTTIHAQTTVPQMNAVMSEAKCIYTNGNSASVMVNGAFVPANLNNLSVKYSLPEDKEYGYSLTAFSNESSNLILLTGSSYVSSEFPCPKDSSSFTLRLITWDPYATKYMLASDINSKTIQDVNVVDVIMGTFGGVLPQYSNIVNGVGLFGSSVADSIRIDLTNLPQ